MMSIYKMECESKFEVGMLGSVYFLGEAIGCIVYTVMESSAFKVQSRLKHLQLKNFIITISLFLVTFVIRNPNTLYGMIFLIGLAKSMCIIQGFPYFIESMPFAYRNLVGTSLHIVDRFLLFFSTFFLKETQMTNIFFPILITGFIFAGVGFILSLFLIDSPQFFHDKGLEVESLQTFAKIVTWNQGKLSSKEFLQQYTFSAPR